jgi:hypothetical protein
MLGASMEATLDLWASSLREVKGRIRPLFTQEPAWCMDPGCGRVNPIPVRGQAMRT